MRTIDWDCEFPKADRVAVKDNSERLLKAWENYYAAGGGVGFYAGSVARYTRRLWEALGKACPEDFSEAKEIAADIASEVVKFGFGD
jgi:hypothetical protein